MQCNAMLRHPTCALRLGQRQTGCCGRWYGYRHSPGRPQTPAEAAPRRRRQTAPPGRTAGPGWRRSSAAPAGGQAGGRREGAGRGSICGRNWCGSADNEVAIIRWPSLPPALQPQPPFTHPPGHKRAPPQTLGPAATAGCGGCPRTRPQGSANSGPAPSAGSRRLQWAALRRYRWHCRRRLGCRQDQSGRPAQGCGSRLSSEMGVAAS